MITYRRIFLCFPSISSPFLLPLHDCCLGRSTPSVPLLCHSLRSYWLGQLSVANCAVLPTANAGQYATSNCKPLPFWFPCKRREQDE